MSARRSQIDRAIEQLDAEIVQLQLARERLCMLRDSTAKAKKKPAKPRPIAKVAGE